MLLLGAWLRVDGIAFGLDLSDAEQAFFTNDTDARGMTLEVRSRFLRGNFRPEAFLVRGPAAFYLFGVADALVAGAWACFHPEGWSGVTAELAVNPSLLYLVHRCVSALAGVLTIALVFRIMRREFDATSALVGALVLAVCYLHVRDSHFGTVDVLSGLATLLAVDRMLLLVRDPTPSRSLACGLLVGAATGVKYFGVLLCAPLVLAHLFARRSAPASGWRPGGRELALALLACPLGFFLSAPGVLLALPDLVRNLAFGADLLAPTASTPWNALHVHARYTLFVGLGEPVALLALAGMVALWRSGRAGRFLVLTALALVPALFATQVQNVRYGLPLVVLCTLPAGFLLARVLERTPRLLRAVVVCLVLAPSLVRSLAFDRILHERDTRAEMLHFLRARGRAPEEVLALGRMGALPVVEKDAGRPFVYQHRRQTDLPPRSIDAILADPPRSILLCLTTPEDKISDWERLEELLRARYREELRLEPGPTPFRFEAVGAPALMITYARPWRQRRPGSRLVLFERVDP